MVQQLKELLSKEGELDSPTLVILDSNTEALFHYELKGNDVVDTDTMIEIQSIDVKIFRNQKQNDKKKPETKTSTIKRVSVNGKSVKYEA